MVTTFPPTHCGIGAYGEQHVAQLREQGNVVDVLSPDQQGNVDFAWDLKGESKILKLLDVLPYYDRVIIQYHWAFFYSDLLHPEHRWETLRTTLSFMLLYLRSRKIEIIAHEIPYLSGKSGWLYKWQWKLVPKLVLHTPTELERFESHYHMRLPKSRLEMRTHHDVFQRFSGHTRESARRQLGIPRDRLVFLCIGFIQRHKGFHRAMLEFSRANLHEAELYVVGSMRVSDSENQKYLDELRQIEREHPNLYVRESFVSNEDFDTWIVAADWIVLPYSEIWSSGVLARARLLERPAIVSSVGGLPDQVGKREILFNTDEELLFAFQSAASSNSATASSAAGRVVHSTSRL